MAAFTSYSGISSRGITRLRANRPLWACLAGRSPQEGRWRRWRSSSTGVASLHNDGASASIEEENGWEMTQSGERREWQRSDLHLVLVNPQIPQNAGNVSRTCAATSVSLHLVGPLGFELDSKKLKRAGLDYWDWVAVKVHPTFEDFHAFFQSLTGPKKLVAFSKLGKRHYAEDGLYQKGTSTWLMFGAETTGLPPEAHEAARASGGDVVKIPMSNYKHVRSLNLATSVGVGVFEAVRQLDGAILPEDVEGAEEAENSLEAAAIRDVDQATSIR